LGNLTELRYLAIMPGSHPLSWIVNVLLDRGGGR
jgi:hypothetical protein